MAKLTGTPGNDSIFGSAEVDEIIGLAGQDGLHGAAGNDLLDGGPGDDFLDGELGDDLMEGGRGDDQYVVNSTNDRITEDADEGTDQVMASASFTLPKHVENMILEFFAGNIDGIGNGQNNKIEGNSGNNVLVGGRGDDVLIASGGDDTLNGGTGKDLLEGGPGRDSFVFDTLIFRFGSNREIDIIRDFSPNNDILAISAAAFGGGLVADEFLVPGRNFIANGNPTPTTSDGTFLYDTDSGALYWDINGVDPGGQVQVAQLDRAPTIDPGHFHIF